MRILNQPLEDFLLQNKKAIYIISFLIFFVFTWMYIPLMWDDSYISYRYALNFIENGHWNWNSDSNYVEAYTNFSYALLAIIPIFFKIDPTIFFKLINILWIVIIVYQMRTHLSSFTLFCMVLLLTIINPYINYHIATGMETVFFLFLIFEASLLLITKPGTKRKEIFFYFILLLLPLTRPEGAFFSVVFFCISYFVNKTRIQSKIVLLAIILFAILYMIWRYNYFGKFLPNTFYLKSVKGFDIKNIFHFLSDSRIYIIALIILNLLVRNRILALLSLSVSIVAVFVYAPSDLGTNINERFSIQIFLPIFIVALLLISKRHFQSIIILFTIFFTASYTNYLNIVTINPQMYYYKEIGKTLSKYSDKNYTLMIGEAGVIPYYSKWECHDFIGLANRDISTNKITVQYIKNISPDIIMLYGRPNDSTDINLAMYDQHVVVDFMKIENTYKFIGDLNCHTWCLKVFMKSTIQDYQSLKVALERELIKSYEYGNLIYCKNNISKWFTLQYLK